MAMNMRPTLRDLVWQGSLSSNEARAVEKMREGVSGGVYVLTVPECMGNAQIIDAVAAVKEAYNVEKVLVLTEGMSLEKL